VTWYFADGTVLDQQIFIEGGRFAEWTNLRVIPVVVTTTVDDRGGGIDFSTLNAQLNGTSFFNGASPPAVPPAFPEKLQITAGGKVLTTLNASTVNDSAFTQVQIEYHPARPRLTAGANTVEVLRVKDRSGNEQSSSTTQGFTFP